MPMKSNLSAGCDSSFVKTIAASVNARAPIGMLIKKTHRHDATLSR